MTALGEAYKRASAQRAGAAPRSVQSVAKDFRLHYARYKASRLRAPGMGAFHDFVLAAPWIGFMLATTAFIAAFMVLAGARAPVTIAANAVVGTAVLLYTFVRLVYLPLPKGEGAFETLTIAVYRALRIF